MAIREARLEPTTIERIHRYRKQRKPALPHRESLAAVRQIVRGSDSAEAAAVAVRGIESAWKRASPATRDAVGLLIAILELSDSVDDALATFGMLGGDGALLKPLSGIRTFVREEFPDARMRIIPGDDVASAYLYVMIPTKDYPSFWAAHAHLRDWVIQQFPWLDGVIHVATRPVSTDV